ncbi:trk system potassium uptake protein TrkH [Nitrosospira sp. Nsp2]|uniref:TrkH family potassium uptake protein n=1 Tax=Nitrosospira sp. Nsp2 TaxID=136548 RepID=UPI000D31B318|nr:TrkH family potassium uptake protein [Nitrosospira sp. Nsp2]PTR16280.1 trk system potassium uptake protein TrkH [Nitrosospira sp. Nsp2]
MKFALLGDRLFQQVKTHVLGLTPPQALVLSYIGLCFVGSLLLKLPAATQIPISWSQAIFTAVSASTVTGLVVVDTGTHFTLLGHWILLFLMQCGGLGLMTFGILIIHLMKGQLGLKHRAALRESFNQSGQGDLRRLMFWAVGFTAIMELLGTAMLAIQWVPEMGWNRGLFYSFFHALSAFNNAGFALAHDGLVAYVANPLVNIVISLLLICGGIGFVVVADVIGKKRFAQYSLHTKLMLIGTLAINLVAMLVVLVLEYGNPATLAALPGWGAKLWASWFQAVTPRSAGYNTLDIGALLPSTAFFITGLMFIGGGSGSTAGGIKLSTFLVVLLTTWAFLKKQERPVVFGRSIQLDIIRKSLAIIVISLLCVTTGIFLLTITETAAFLDLAFEGVSAAATVGLSRGITADLSLAGQAIIVILMVIGRVGPLTIAFTLATTRGESIQYPSGQVSIG